MKKILIMAVAGFLMLTACNNPVMHTELMTEESVTRSTETLWDAQAVYVKGDRVFWQGMLYQSKWWTQGEEPGTTGEWGVWETLGVYDTEAPSVPVDILAGESTLNAVSFKWRDSVDNVGVAGYNVYENGHLVATNTYSQIVIFELKYSTTYTYTITAFDAAGNESAHSAPVSSSTLKGIDVVVPSNVNVIVRAESEIMVVWDSVPGATYYDIEVDGEVILNTSHPYFHKDLIPGSVHTYRVKAGNSNTVSEWSPLITAEVIKDRIYQ